MALRTGLQRLGVDVLKLLQETSLQHHFRRSYRHLRVIEDPLQGKNSSSARPHFFSFCHPLPTFVLHSSATSARFCLVNAVEIGRQSDLVGPHLRNDGGDGSRKILMQLKGFLVWLRPQAVEGSSVSAMCPENFPVFR